MLANFLLFAITQYCPKYVCRFLFAICQYIIETFTISRSQITTESNLKWLYLTAFFRKSAILAVIQYFCTVFTYFSRFLRFSPANAPDEMALLVVRFVRGV